MATYEIKKEGNNVRVKVTIPALPEMAAAARKAKEVVRQTDVYRHLASQGIEVNLPAIQGNQISNFTGPATEEYVFEIKGAPAPKEVAPPVAPEKKSLTNEAKPAIIDHSAKTTKRKRSKDGSTSNKTEDTSE